jgi:uncharacterized repeat protein (TIGR02543 family)
MKTKKNPSKRVINLSIFAVLVGTLLSFSSNPVSATSTTCYVVVAGVLTDGSACSGDVVIDSSVTSIEQRPDQYGAFQGSGITSVTIPASVTYVGYGAFWESSALTSVTFAPNSNLAELAQHAFSNTTNLKSITLPSSLVTISSIAFSGSGIRYIIFQGAPPTVNNYNGPGDLQNVSASAIAWVTSGNYAAFSSQSPKILPTVRTLTGSTPPPTIAFPSAGETLTATVGSGYSQSVNFYGAGNPTLEISAGSLPPGISLNGSGQFVGTPTTIAPLVTRTYPISLRAIDGAESVTVSVVFEILPPPLPEILAETFTANVGIPMNREIDLFSIGGRVVTLVEGLLPPGVSITGSNRLVGTPTTAGTYSAKLRVTDSYSQAVNSNDFVFVIGSPVTVNLSASQASLSLTAVGETATYSVISTNAPDNYVICGFYKDADNTGGSFLIYDCSQKQWNDWVSNGITSEEYYYTDYENSTLIIRAYGPDATVEEYPDINTPYLATVTVSLNRVIPQPTITISATDFQPRTATNVGVTLSNFDTSLNYQATVKFVNVTTNADVSNGKLVATKGGTSVIPGYTSYSGTKLGFKGTYAQVAAALASLTWNPATGSGNISMRIGIASMPGTNEFYYDANSGHYYKYVSTALPWVSARTASEATTLFGLRGYLAEVNSEAENFFIGRETTATNVWIGASDRTVEGTWIWDGATNAYPKPTGSGTNSGRSATFHSWANGEPNDWPWHGPSKPEREDCAVTNWQGKIGMWNDWPCLISQGYLIEFGGRPGETSTAIGATLTTVVNAVPPVQYTITYDPLGGNETPTAPSRTTGEKIALAGAITKATSGGITYQFAGWNTGGTLYKAGETFTVGSANLTFSAEWVQLYQVTYAVNGGSFSVGETTNDAECTAGANRCTNGQTIELNSAPTRAGYTFVDWKNQSGTSVVDTNNAVAGIQTAVTSANYIFSATWTPITYTVTYTSSGSSVPTQSSLEQGETFTVGTAGTRVGFRFDGWSDGVSLYFPESTFTVETSTITLEAEWTAVFTVTYSQGLGSGTPATDPASYPVGYALAVDTDAGISRSGFTFSGWSDGTTIYQVGDIYTIGSNNITLTAQWSAVPVTQAPAPTPSPTLTPTVNPISVETLAAQTAAAAAVKLARDTLQITVAKNQKTYQEIFASVTTSNSSTSTMVAEKKLGAVVNTRSESINSSQSANFRVAARNISLSNDVIEEFKSRIRIMVTTTGISVTPVSGFTGVLIVPFAATVDGIETVVLNQIVVNPAPPVAQNFAPTSINRSSIAWAPSTSQTAGYLVKINGKEICQTTANSCPVAQLIGPKSVVTIAALGNDKTVSTQVVIPYVATRPIPALKVNFAVGSSVLSREQKIEIRSVARVIDTQGFTRLVVSGFTDSSGSSALNKALSEARAKSVAAFMRTLLPKVAIKASAFGPKKPLASNGSESGKAQNRRTEIATW